MSWVWALPLVVAMQTRSAGVSPRPAVWAAQSPRPAACLAAPGLWETARQATTARHCRALARAQVLLLRAPEQALQRATALLQQAPELSEARVLRGRASLRLGDAEQALKDLLPLLAEGSPIAAEPATLLDGGRAALLRHDTATAARFYRQLGSRAAMLPTLAEQTIAYVEIAAVLLAAEGSESDDALAYLREARARSAGSGYTSLIIALTAVAWVVGGHEAEAQGALTELGDPWSLRRFETSTEPRLPEGAIHAVLGLAFERHKSDLASEHYRLLEASPLGSTGLGKIGGRRREPARRGGK